jgi:cytochrome c
MNYAGLKKPGDRAALIAWLRAQGSDSFPLPSAAEIAAEAAKLAPPEEDGAAAAGGEAEAAHTEEAAH